MTPFLNIWLIRKRCSYYLKFLKYLKSGVLCVKQWLTTFFLYVYLSVSCLSLSVVRAFAHGVMGRRIEEPLKCI